MRGTGNAIALAALLIAKRDPNAIMGSFAADHKIANTAEFHRALSTAIASAEAGYLTTIGIEPSHPETGYGYIERSDDLALPGGYFARRFVEKPDLATAEAFLATGRYLWNASMFVWRVDVFLREFEHAQPELFGALAARLPTCWDDPARFGEIERAWLDLPVTTIDQGLMEHVEEFVVVPVEMGWSDIGDWNGFAELIAADDDGNCFNGNVVTEDSSRCVVWSERDRPVALVGVHNLAVIDLEDALMIVDRDNAQQVRAIVYEDGARSAGSDMIDNGSTDIPIGLDAIERARESALPAALWTDRNPHSPDSFRSAQHPARLPGLAEAGKPAKDRLVQDSRRLQQHREPDPAQAAAGIVTASAGNHAQGVALAAAALRHRRPNHGLRADRHPEGKAGKHPRIRRRSARGRREFRSRARCRL